MSRLPSTPDQSLSPAEEAFERLRKRLGLVLAPLAFFLTYWLSGDTLTPEGRRVASVLAAVVILWTTEVIPLPVTALLGPILCVLLGAGKDKAILASFADPIVFVFIGSFILARAMMIHALDRRIALAFLSLPAFGSSPAFMMAGLGLVTAVISMWVSNTATTAMMLPIALGVLGALHEVRLGKALVRGPIDARNWTYATGVMLMIAYSASIGGIGTPIGSPPNLIGIRYVRDLAGRDISFFQWCALCIPIFAFMAVALFTLLYLLHPAKHEALHGAFKSSSPRSARVKEPSSMARYIADERAALGPWTRGQVNTLIAFLVAVTLWILPGVLSLPAFEQAWYSKWVKAHLTESVVACLAAALLFLLPVSLKEGRFTLTWEQAVKIDWGTILLFGGGLALGTLMDTTGVARTLGNGLTDRLGVSSLWALTALSIAMAIVLSEATSNTAAAHIIIPVVIAVAKAAGVSPVPPALGAVLGASFGFMLPVSTPPNAIVYGSGLVPIPRMMRAGIVFDVIGFFLILLGLYILCPLLKLM